MSFGYPLRTLGFAQHVHSAQPERILLVITGVEHSPADIEERRVWPELVTDLLRYSPVDARPGQFGELSVACGARRTEVSAHFGLVNSLWKYRRANDP